MNCILRLILLGSAFLPYNLPPCSCSPFHDLDATVQLKRRVFFFTATFFSLFDSLLRGRL